MLRNSTASYLTGQT